MDRRAVGAIATLDDEVRGALYDCVRAATSPVTRETAAASVGISRSLAAFHLDKLVEAGLLQAGVDAGATPRVGRAPKVYRPAADTVAVSLPPRRPELLADILVAAIVDESRTERAGAVATRVARERGVVAGATERDRLRPGRLGVERAVRIVGDLLEQQGFEPAPADGGVRLRNCPFHPMATTAPELVCGLNHAFLDGVIDGLQAGRCLEAVLAPREGACCVELRPR